MKLSLYNTLTQHLEICKPLNKNLVKMYVCGPTVYDHPHIGNARSVVVYDILYRILLQLFGFEHVLYVRNITDIDDKIINQAKKLNISINALTEKTTNDFHTDMAYIGCLNPNIEPKATEHIEDMILIIEKLLDLKHAYIAYNHVYFNILSAKNYTKLSGRNLNELFDGVRIESSKSKKHHGDFVLWKPADNEDDATSIFDSPWGKGRPGWHIECSAMSYKYLGENFDIHGGGADLIFPHHTNEIAQSTCAFANSEFAKLWVHNGFVTVAGEKMSKSLGNFITIKDLISKNIPGEVIRLCLANTHYRKPLNFNDKALSDSAKMLDYWYRAIEDLEIKKITMPDNFFSALLGDINTPMAIKIINDYAKLSHAASNKTEKLNYASALVACANFIGLMQQSTTQWFAPATNNQIKIDELIEKRSIAKQAKNWGLADQIRQDLLNQGIILEDKTDGSTSWRKA